MRFTPAALLLLLAPMPSGAKTFTGSIQGRVVGEDGTPMSGATVSYKRATKLIRTRTGSYRPSPGEPQAGGQVVTTSDGSFVVPNLPAGDYGLCAGAAGFLSTCTWGASVGVKLADGQSADAGRITLQRGALVQVQVNDPSRLLSDPTPMHSPIFIAVRWGVRFSVAGQAAKDAVSRTFSMLVPYGEPLKLWVKSREVRLADASGTPLDSRGSSIAFTVTRNTTPSGFTLNVQRRVSP